MSEAEARRDGHSFANPHEVRVKHVDLDLDVLFESRNLKGTATLKFDRQNGYDGPLLLDTRDLSIERVESSKDAAAFVPAKFELGARHAVLGASLKIQLPPDATAVRIAYTTAPSASGLQWLKPSQTAGRKQPFLFSQSQAIHARSWIPLQDSPGVRVTYSARIRTPKDLRAVMSAENDPQSKNTGEYQFDMPQAIPSYLIALAVGDLAFRPIGKRTGVYAEPGVVEKAQKEFEDTEQMMTAVEALYGPYRWGRYDILVLPPSFPFGGMENPRLTFATPTILAGDKSLVALIAHELAHSWSGNLVTNATWRDFWLNEGFTVYLELRIQEAVFGRARSEMQALLDKDDMEREMKTLPARDQILHVDLKGRDPDDGFTQVPYVKGMLFLRRLEEVFGREKLDAFLRAYFDRFAFQSIVTQDFRDYLKTNLLDKDPELAAKIDVDEWIEKAAMPKDTPQPVSDAFAKVRAHAESWRDGKSTLSSIPTKAWSTQEWLHFLTSLPEDLSAAKMTELDRAFRLSQSGNAEILNQWFLMAIRGGYEPAYRHMESFLLNVGRRKYLKPLYTELAKTEAGKTRAKSIYARAKEGYHPIAAATIDTILK